MNSHGSGTLWKFVDERKSIALEWQVLRINVQQAACVGVGLLHIEVTW